MFRSSFRKPLIVLFFVTVGYQHAASQDRDYVRIPYPDSLKSLGIKIEVWSVLANHAMAGIEIPLKKNAFFEFNLGVSGLVNNQEYFEYEYGMRAQSGFMLRTGFKLPIIYTTALSMVYLMPEYAYTGYKISGSVYDYNTGNQVPKTYNIRMSALLLNFGYRHINPHSGFFYDIGMGYGVGFTNNLGYGYRGYSFDMATNYYENPEQGGSGVASTFRGSIGWVLKKKTN
jgi:hypothetical protein